MLFPGLAGNKIYGQGLLVGQCHLIRELPQVYSLSPGIGYNPRSDLFC